VQQFRTLAISKTGKFKNWQLHSIAFTIFGVASAAIARLLFSLVRSASSLSLSLETSLLLAAEASSDGAHHHDSR
jgi:hypothetical protein